MATSHGSREGPEVHVVEEALDAERRIEIGRHSFAFDARAPGRDSPMVCGMRMLWIGIATLENEAAQLTGKDHATPWHGSEISSDWQGFVTHGSDAAQLMSTPDE
eukprot:Skav208950  [mRNA]  locus=scaffold1580:97358:102538:- [translate_table: standard]